MYEINTNSSNGAFSEAPASWNTRYSTPDGFVCQLTLRGESGKDLLEKANAALNWLIDNGYQPSEYKSNRYVNNNSSKATQEKTEVSNSTGENLCPIHHCEMQKWEKNGKIWYSHKVEGGWCTGKAK